MLFNIRPDIASSVAKTIFTSDMRSVLPQVLSHTSIFATFHGLGSNITVLAFKTNALRPVSIFVSIFSPRSTSFQVQLPCHILQSAKALAVPVFVAAYTLGGPTAVEILPTEGHLPQLSALDAVVSALKLYLLSDICIREMTSATAVGPRSLKSEKFMHVKVSLSSLV